MVMVIADGALEFLEFEDDRERHQWFTARHYPEGLPPVRRDETGISKGLADYFRGDLRALDALPARPRGTEFQQTVWSELRRIPYGETTTYRALAQSVGRPKAIRAAGAANGSNPVSVVIPCHRVIGSGGSLTGYGGGFERKQWLLSHEGAR